MLQDGGYLGKSGIGYVSSIPASQLIIDEFRLYNGVLSSADVHKNFIEGPDQVVCHPCAKGQYSGDVGNIDCDICATNTYAPNTGATSCYACPAASTSVSGSAVCLCDIGYYMSASANECIMCDAGSTTDAAGSIGSADCINLASSFAFGLILLPVCLIVFLLYIVTGRIHQVATMRKDYCVQWIASSSAKIVASVQIWSEDKAQTKRKDKRPHTLWAMIKSWLCILGMVAAICIGAAFNFVASVARAIFSSIIISRALQNAGYVATEAVMTSIRDWLESIASYLFFLHYVFDPIMWVVDQLGDLSISYKALGITCHGSQAPLKLFLNLFILFAVVIVIEADYHILMTHCIAHGCKSYCMWSMKSLPRVLSFLTSALVMLLMQVQPLLSVLQYLMTIVSIADFVSDHGRHPSTEACDIANSMESMDTLIAILTTICALIIFTPAISTIARIMYPGMPKVVRNFDGKGGVDVYHKHYFDVKANHSIQTTTDNAQNTGSVKDSSKSQSSLLAEHETWLAFFSRQLGSLDLWLMLGFEVLLNRFAEQTRGIELNAGLSEDSKAAATNKLRQRAEHPAVNPPAPSSKYEVLSARETPEEAEADEIVVSADVPYELPTTRELIDLILIEWNIRWTCFRIPAKIFFFVPVSQLLFSSVGRYFWFVVLWKFYSFFVVSVGFWTKISYNNYNLQSRLTEFITKSELQRSFLDGTAGIVTPRAVLWQLVPQFTLLTIFTLQTANSPFIGFPHAAEQTFVYFASNPVSESWATTEHEEGANNQHYPAATANENAQDCGTQDDSNQYRDASAPLLN
eukprot:gene21995-28084_t